MTPPVTPRFPIFQRVLFLPMFILTSPLCFIGRKPNVTPARVGFSPLRCIFSFHLFESPPQDAVAVYSSNIFVSSFCFVSPPQDAFVVYSSNVFALLALRSLYVVLSKSVQSMHYLKHAVAFILLFVGLKMILEVSSHSFGL